MKSRIHLAAPCIAHLKEFLLTCAVLALLAGCGPQNVRIGENIDIPAPARQIQRSVGIYYDESFKGYVHTATRYGDTWVIPLGETGVNESNDAFSKLFSSTRVVSKRPLTGAVHKGGTKELPLDTKADIAITETNSCSRSEPDLLNKLFLS